MKQDSQSLPQDLIFQEIIAEEQPLSSEINNLDFNNLVQISQKFRLSYDDKMHERSAEIRIQNLEHEVKDDIEYVIFQNILQFEKTKIKVQECQTHLQNMINHFFSDEEGSMNSSSISKGSMSSSCKESKKSSNKELDGESLSTLQKVLDLLSKLKKLLMLRESQLSTVIFIMQKIKLPCKEEFKKEYMQNYESIKKFIIPIQKCEDPLNGQILNEMLELEVRYLNQYEVLLEGFESFEVELLARLLSATKQYNTLTKKQSQVLLHNANQSKILMAKLNTIADLFSYACIKDSNDLFSLKKSHPRWQNLTLQQIIQYKDIDDPNIIQASFDSLKNNLNTINSVMSLLDQSKHLSFSQTKNWKRIYSNYKQIIKCTFSEKAAKQEAEILISEPNKQLAKEIWNLPEKKQLQSLISYTLPSIQFSCVHYIPRILKEYFHKMLENKQLNLQIPDYMINNIEDYQKQLNVEKAYEERIKIRINHKFKIEERKPRKIEEQQENKSKKMKIWSGFTKISEKMHEIKNNIFKGEQEKGDAGQLIFHIHGGGFISMSSFIHQSYTRTWSNNLNVPIISVDYGKAPQHSYPCGLYDCLEAYFWVLFCFRQVYKVQPTKIIFVGDSAGGNLVAALTTLLISWKLPTPNGIVLVYPALNLNYYDYTPSLLTALDDMILPHTFLKICLDEYLQKEEYEADADPFISPIVTPDQILQQYPHTRIFVGSKDPFHDDCCRFAEKINHHTQDKVKLVVFNQFPHGFLQFDMKAQPHPYCKQATKQVEESLKELLEKQ